MNNINLNDFKENARIILDWDDGQWYVSEIIYSGEPKPEQTKNIIQQKSTSSNIKLAEWSNAYKYQPGDIVAFEGHLYVSNQNNNINNQPDKDKFWWKNLLDLSNVDAVSIEGRTYKQLVNDILLGKSITDFYTKDEVKNLVLQYFNNVNAKKLADWSITDIKNDYETLIENKSTKAKEDAINYFKNENNNSYQLELIEYFNEQILPDNINRG